LISGAGIAGPTLAWFLAKAGARIIVVEKPQSLLPHGQNVDTKDAAITITKKMGSWIKFDDSTAQKRPHDSSTQRDGHMHPFLSRKVPLLAPPRNSRSFVKTGSGPL
jgi:2-polyprenyl-6-methoxyphenol hydroxylase-like FAD-dependent oxidoreductase